MIIKLLSTAQTMEEKGQIKMQQTKCSTDNPNLKQTLVVVFRAFENFRVDRGTENFRLYCSVSETTLEKTQTSSYTYVI